jgi:hypothetical protein
MKKNMLMDKNILTNLEQVAILGGFLEMRTLAEAELKINICSKAPIFADCKKIC